MKTMDDFKEEEFSNLIHNLSKEGYWTANSTIIKKSDNDWIDWKDRINKYLKEFKEFASKHGACQFDVQVNIGMNPSVSLSLSFSITANE